MAYYFLSNQQHGIMDDLVRLTGIDVAFLPESSKDFLCFGKSVTQEKLKSFSEPVELGVVTIENFSYFCGRLFIKYMLESPDRTTVNETNGEFKIILGPFRLDNSEELESCQEESGIPDLQKVTHNYLVTYLEAIVKILNIQRDDKCISNTVMDCNKYKAIKSVMNVLDGIVEAAFFKDIDGKYQDCNKAFENLLGVSKDLIRGKTLFDLDLIIPIETAMQSYNADVETVNANSEILYPMSIKTRSGKIRNFQMRKSCFYDNSGRYIGIIGTMVEITDSTNILLLPEKNAH